MKSFIFRIFVMLAVLLPSLSAYCLDLPVKTVKGREVYYYKVKNNESVYGISKRLGVSREDIVRHNPSVADGVKRGMMLYFPVDEYADVVGDTVVVVDTEMPIVVDTLPAIVEKKASVALLLPFGLEASEPSRRNKLALDFYKGFLLGADTLADRPGRFDIYAFDIDSPSRTLESVLEDSAVMTAAVIVAPDDPATLATIAATARERENYVLNVFVVADTLYASNPMVVQANIPQKMMYKLAADGLMADFAGYTPVILKNTGGRNEKEAFTAYVVDRYREQGIEPILMNYENNLLMADLETLPISAGERYVFIPSSGSLAEFNKFAYVVKSFRDRLAMAETADDADALAEPAPRAQAAVFGYPDWTAFRGDALDALHKLEVTVYSRFFDNFSGFDTRSLESAFRQWYGTEIIESVPSQALLGYDTACFVIKNIKANNGVFNPLYPSRFEGIQSTFDFDKTDAGYCNATLYIINYLPGGRMSARTL